MVAMVAAPLLVCCGVRPVDFGGSCESDGTKNIVDGTIPAGWKWGWQIASKLLLDAAREVHGGSGLLRHAGEFPAAESSEYRMSADAERYHKSGPSALRRYLPYWAVVWIQRLLYFGLPLLVVGLPLTRVLPIVYRWGVRRRIYRWYGELSFLERAAALQPARCAEHLQRLGEIEARVNRLRIPASFAGEAYTLRMHVQMVRERLRGTASGGVP